MGPGSSLGMDTCGRGRAGGGCQEGGGLWTGATGRADRGLA